MKSLSTMFNYANRKEPILEPVLRELRFNIIKNFLLTFSNKNWVILDFGCGPEAKFYKYIRNNKISFKKYYGYDPLKIVDINDKDFQLTSNIKRIYKNKYDLITMFAVLEHLDFPNPDFSFLSRLKPGSFLIITTPTLLAKPVLEFLSYRLGIISKREILEHKHYYTFNEIERLFSGYGYKMIKAKVFELGMNNLVILKKQS
jgi:SAM-dependent methyltransferase